LLAPAGQKHGRGKMKFRRRANSNDNAIRAESLLKTDDWELEAGFLVDPSRRFAYFSGCGPLRPSGFGSL